MKSGALALCLPVLLGAAEPLTESEVIRLARERSAAAGAAEASRDLQRAAAAGVTYPNPSLFWSRQHIPGDSLEAESEDGLGVSVPLDFSGRRAARSALARASAARAESRAFRVRSSAVREALDAFYRAIYAELRVEVAEGRLARLREAARVLGRRRSEGTASGSEEARLRLEVELAESDRRELAMGMAESRAHLAAFLALPELPELKDDLEARPGSAPSEARPSRVSAEGAYVEARRALEAAATAWIPAVSLTGGLFIRDSGVPTYGYLAGVSLALPVFSRGQGLTARAEAQLALARRTAEALDQDARARAGAAEARLRGLLAEAQRFERAVAEPLEVVARAARRGYEEGRTTVVELVDALRVHDRVRVRQLELRLSAKQAELHLRDAKGDLE